MATFTNPVGVNEGILEADGIQHPFTKGSEIKESWESTDYADGTAGGKTRKKRTGGPNVDNMTFECPYQPGVTDELLAWLRDKCAGEKTFTRTHFDACEDRVRETWTMLGCMPVNYSIDAIDHSGSAIQMLKFEVRINDLERTVG